MKEVTKEDLGYTPVSEYVNLPTIKCPVCGGETTTLADMIMRGTCRNCGKELTLKISAK